MHMQQYTHRSAAQRETVPRKLRLALKTRGIGVGSPRSSQGCLDEDYHNSTNCDEASDGLMNEHGGSKCRYPAVCHTHSHGNHPTRLQHCLGFGCGENHRPAAFAHVCSPSSFLQSSIRKSENISASRMFNNCSLLGLSSGRTVSRSSSAASLRSPRSPNCTASV